MAYSSGDRPDVAGVLADRLAATLVHHEPGWRLPRPSAIARRYDVRPAQVEEAVRELAARHLIRQLPDGQLYRASPAELLIPVQGVPRLGAHVDPMGGEVLCRNRKVSWRRVPQDIGWALGAAPGDSICAVKCHWSVNGEPAAISTTYLTKAAASQLGELTDASGIAAVDLLLGGAVVGVDQRPLLGRPAALHLEMQPPLPSVARGLRLGAGQPAAIITVRFDDPASGRPVALSVAALRADMFRIVVESAASELPLRALESADARDDPSPKAQAQAGDDWSDGDRPAGDRPAGERPAVAQ